MTALSSALVLVLWQSSAGAPAQLSPEQLLDQYTATGETALIERCQLLVAALPRSNRSRLLHAKLLIASGETQKALTEAIELNREIPDELDPYGLIVDASLLLGDVKEAETAGQWMLKLRPEDVRSLMRGAAVREVIKDYYGAEQMLGEALGRTSRTDTLTRAAIGVSLARLSMRRGNLPGAAKLLTQVNTISPGFRPAMLLKRELEKSK